MSDEIFNNLTDKNKPHGLGGWLIFPMLGLFLSLLFALSGIYDYAAFFEPQTWSAITTPGTNLYDPFWLPSIAISLLSLLFTLIFSVWLLILGHRKKASFPRWIIIFYIIGLVSAVFDWLVIGSFISRIFPGQGIYIEREAISNTTRTLGACVIWIPYFLRSQRVKNTFTN